MKNILKLIGGIIAAAYKKITGKSDDVIVQLPENIAITPAQIDQVIAIVNQVKAVVNNPVTILITDLIPTSIDNVIREGISEALPDIITGLTFVKKWLTGNKEEVTIAALERVQMSTDPDKDAFYHSLAARLIMIVSDGKVTWSEAVSFIEVYFKQSIIIK